MLDTVIDDLLYQSHNEPNFDIIDKYKLIEAATQSIFHTSYLDLQTYLDTPNKELKTKLKADAVSFFLIKKNRI